MQFIKLIDPETGAEETDEVEITAVHEDGSFDYQGAFASGYRARETLYDAEGNEVQASVNQPSAQLSNEILQAIQILLGGDANG